MNEIRIPTQPETPDAIRRETQGVCRNLHSLEKNLDGIRANLQGVRTTPERTAEKTDD